MPDPIAAEILQRCDGARAISAIADELAAKYQAPREQVGQDILQMVQDLADKGVLTA